MTSLKSFASLLTLFLMFLFVSAQADSKTIQENLLAKAIQLFDKKDFKEAEPVFRELLNERPDDFMINYFYGACRTENGHYSKKTLAYLQKASKEVSPLDIDYYLGVQNQAQENWEQALKHYNKFGKTVGENESKRVNLPEKIQQCYDKINPYPVEKDEPEPLADSTMATENITLAATTLADSSVEKQDSLQAEELYEENQDSTFAEKMPEPDAVSVIEAPADPQINFSINSEITYKLLSQFKTEEGRELFKSATEKQKQLDKNLKTLDFLRGKYASTYERSKKDSIGEQILNLENYTYELKGETNQMMMQSKSLENEYWQNASDDEIQKFRIESTKIEEAPTTAKITYAIEQDNSEPVIPEILVKDAKPESPTSKSDNSDLVYKIQVGAYSRGIPSYKKSLFNKISLIRKIDNYTDEKGVVVYTTGNLTRFEDALVMQKQVRQEGIDDAFIVPYLQGKRITLEQAKEIEGIK
ncbi:MAG: hypothetical protein R2757_06610 [Draconibacterium sp.]